MNVRELLQEIVNNVKEDNFGSEIVFQSRAGDFEFDIDCIKIEDYASKTLKPKIIIKGGY
jgi:hypothetical protein